jgi:hypothetical protein
MQAGKSKITEDRVATVLLREDVLDLKRSGRSGVNPLRQMAVLARIPGTSAYFVLERFIHDGLQ